MSSQIEKVTRELRRLILAGELASGERIREVQFAAELGVSRTPLRLALGELESEGLLERLPTRGFRVREITLDEVSMAIDVRGNLEGMAARLLAETGASQELLAVLRQCVAQGRALIEAARQADLHVDTMDWSAMNARLHHTLAAGSGNSALVAALAHVAKTPMAGPGALGVSGAPSSLELGFLERAQFDHEDILHAIEAGEGGRAEALMREHARRSRDNKKALLGGLKANGLR